MTRNKRWLALLVIIVMGPSWEIRASYFEQTTFVPLTYQLSSLPIPTAPGATTEWRDSGTLPYTVVPDYSPDTSLQLSVSGALLTDGVSWQTTNSGVGVQFKVSDVNNCLPESTNPPYKISLPPATTCVTSALRVSYRLVRLADYVPSGIVGMPSVQVAFQNYAGAPVASFTQMYYNGGSDQPPITPCVINVPSTVQLDDIFATNLQAGTMNMKNVPVTLTQCPGAITNIRYALESPYGIVDIVNGIINTKAGSATGIYFQLLRSTSEPYIITEVMDLENYNGSGDYSIPLYVAYYVVAPEQVSPGNVESQVTIDVLYE